MIKNRANEFLYFHITMKFKLSTISFFLLMTSSLFAGKDNNTMGARSAGLANSSILLKDFWAAENNPAMLGRIKSFGAGLAYENHFLLPEFSYRSAALAQPFDHSALGISIGQFGYNLYQENEFGIAYGQSFGESLSMGLQLNYQNISLGEGLGNKGVFSANYGIAAKINKVISLAAVIVNINRPKLADYQDERLPTLLKLGLSYTYSDKVIFLSEIEKDIEHSPIARFGIEYFTNETIYLRVGYASNPSLSSFGFGIKFSNFQFDIASSYHNNLGFSPQLSLSYRPNSKK